MDETEEIMALWRAMYGDDGHSPIVSVRCLGGVFIASVRASGNANEGAAHGCDAMASRVALRDKLRSQAVGSMWRSRTSGRSYVVKSIDDRGVRLTLDGTRMDSAPFSLREFYSTFAPPPTNHNPIDRDD